MTLAAVGLIHFSIHSDTWWIEVDCYILRPVYSLTGNRFHRQSLPEFPRDSAFGTRHAFVSHTIPAGLSKSSGHWDLFRPQPAEAIDFG
jgi:hypothetical protein